MDIAILHIDDFGQDLFEELFSASSLEEIDLRTESRPNQPMAALEWMILPAIAIYIAKPFVDKFLAKAAEDSVAVAYPRFKTAIQSLVVRLLKRERSRFRTVSSGKGKVVDEGAWLFGIYTVTRNNQRAKFIFGDGLTEEQYQCAVARLFELLNQHHVEGTADDITLGLHSLANPNASEIYLLFDRQNERWRVVDPMAEIRRIKDGNTEP